MESIFDADDDSATNKSVSEHVAAALEKLSEYKVRQHAGNYS